jgi:hypothetical protein
VYEGKVETYAGQVLPKYVADNGFIQPAAFKWSIVSIISL